MRNRLLLLLSSIALLISLPIKSYGLQAEQWYLKGYSIYNSIDKIESANDLMKIDSLLVFYRIVIKADNNKIYVEIIKTQLDSISNKLKDFITSPLNHNNKAYVQKAYALIDEIDSLTNKSKNSFWFYFEIVLIFCVIIYQLVHSKKVYYSIEELKRIFKNPIFIKNGFIQKANLKKEDKSVDDIIFPENGQKYNEYNNNEEYSKISIAYTDGEGIIAQIGNDINNYLINNYGADVNFSNIKDIIDRQIEVKDNEISQSITTPLYLGLAATMIGIIFGLLAMPDLSSGGFSEGIFALIKGVRWAMSASLIGLACTSYLSVIKYKDANKTLLEGKNKQISYLQAKLLPAIIDANQTGLQGLKTQIDQFSRDAFKISTELKETALNNQNSLIKTCEVIYAQQEIIKKIEKIDIFNVIKANVALFDKLEKNIYAFKQFSEYIELMGQISYQLHDFASRTANIDTITRHIESSLSDNKQLIEFLSSHFNKIENAGNAALNAVNIADSKFKEAVDTLKNKSDEYFNQLLNSISESSSKFSEAIDKLNSEIETRIEKINQNSADHESKLSEIYNDIGNKLKKITEEYINQLNSTFKESAPRLNELKYLTELPVIREQFTNNHNSKKIIDIVEGLNESVLKIKENINHNNLLIKLSTIEEALKRKNRTPQELIFGTNNPQIPVNKIKPVSIFEAINKLFKN